MSYKQHPLSSAFPAMAEDDFRALVDDIKKHGQRDPVALYEGFVIDGWHRYRACLEVGRACRFYNPEINDAVAFVRSKNQHRRHYMKSQQAAIEVALATWAEAHRPKRVKRLHPLRRTSKWQIVPEQRNERFNRQNVPMKPALVMLYATGLLAQRRLRQLRQNRSLQSRSRTAKSACRKRSSRSPASGPAQSLRMSQSRMKQLKMALWTT